MARLKLKSVVLRNFGAVKESKVEFPARGFILVNGNNLTCPGKAKSVGSGKTLLGEAISRALFAVPGRAAKFSKYSRRRKGDTYVAVEAALDDTPLLVELGYKCHELNKSGEGLRYTLGNNAPISYGNMLDTRAELSRIVGMTPDVAGWTVFINGRKLDFTGLSENASVDLLMGVLNQPPWKEFHRKALTVADGFKTAAEKSTGRCDALKSSLDQAEAAVAAAKASLAAAEAELATETKARDERVKVRQQQLNALAAALATSNELLAGIKRQIEEAENAEAAAYQVAELKLQRSNSELAEAQRAYASKLQQHNSLKLKLEGIKSGKQKAANSYLKEAYAKVNTERFRILAENDAIDKRNSASVSARAAKEKQLLADKHAAELEFSGATAAVDIAAALYDKELTVPTKCPFPGCDKVWPRTNQKKLDAAKKQLDAAKQALAQKSEALKTCADLLCEFSKETPKLEEKLPIVAEQAVPPFPDEERWDNEITVAQCEADTLAAQVADAESNSKTKADAVATAQAELDALKKASAVTGLSQQYEKASKDATAAQSRIKELELETAADVVSDTLVAAAKTRLEERQSVLAKTKQDLDDAAQASVESEEAVKAAQYWVEAYSPTGIPNMIIDEAIKPLNMISKKVSMRLSGDMLEVIYSTSRTLANGRERNEIVLTSSNAYGSDDAELSSNGENGLLNLIVAETLAEVGNVSARVGYRWYDEVATSQDELIRRSIFNYIKEQATALDSLFFVVDHAPEVSSYADRVLVAEKTPEGGTTYTWQ